MEIPGTILFLIGVYLWYLITEWAFEPYPKWTLIFTVPIQLIGLFGLIALIVHIFT